MVNQNQQHEAAAQARHTPGPWTVRVAKRGRRSHIVAGSRGEIGYVSGDSYIENARLIAAAPDLLAACMAIRQSVALKSVQSPGDVKMAEIAQAAIDKAIGSAKRCCDGCSAPASGQDLDGVPLCSQCGEAAERAAIAKATGGAA